MIDAIIYRHGENDFEAWFPDLPDEAVREIEQILIKYDESGYSVRGSAIDIRNEICMPEQPEQVEEKKAHHCMKYMCRDCVDAIRSRGEKIYTRNADIYDFDDFDEMEKITCDWCDEEIEDPYDIQIVQMDM